MTYAEKYRFYPYYEKYPEYFESERNRLASSLGAGAAIEHVGSSAVPGLGGKRFIDVVVGVGASVINSAMESITNGGYEYRRQASTDERQFFRADRIEDDVEYRVHVHLVELHEDEWRKLVCFRDHLRTHVEVANEYARVKEIAAAVAKGDGAVYMNAKEGFIADAVEKAMRWCRGLPPGPTGQ